MVKALTPLRTAGTFPKIMMMGVIVLMVVLEVASEIATELNPATSGSTLLNQLGTITEVKAWLSSLPASAWPWPPSSACPGSRAAASRGSFAKSA